MPNIDVSTFVGGRHHYLPREHGGRAIEFGVPRLHYESLDTWSTTASCCLDWRAEIHLSALDAYPQSPDVVAGFVDFLLLRLGEEPVAEVLERYGAKAADFSELFEGQSLSPDLDEADGFTDGMPFFAVLLVLDAEVDDSLEPHGHLRPWAVSEVAHTVLPTTSGLVAMRAIPSPTPLRGVRRLVGRDTRATDGEVDGRQR